MDTGSYRFAVGGFECISISDGAFNYPLEVFFANASREEVEEALRRRNLPTDRVTTPYTCLFVDTGQHRVLIDTGAGNLGAAAPTMFPSINHATTVTGKLLGQMRNRLSLVNDGAEVVPGIRVVAATGHTPGHIALSITSGGEQLLHISDVVL